MKIVPLLFQFIFYTGSWVPEPKYRSLVKQIEKHPNVEKVQFHKWFQNPPQDRNDTILIGHSLGGYFALQDAVRHPERVAGVVLLNSHFNSRGTMPYPGIPISGVDVPVLTVLGGKDDRLPIRKALDDAWECVQEQDNNKFFTINKDFTHWTGITKVIGQEKIVRPIHTFVDALETRNFTGLRQMDTYRNRFRPDFVDLSSDAVVASQSVNIIDAILGLVIPRFLWKFAHFLWFLTAKPDEVLSFLFVDDNHIFLKGKEKDHKNYAVLLREWLRNEPFEIRDYYLPPLHPFILFWLWFPLQPYRKDEKIIAPRIILEVNDETTYYKVPNPRKFFNLVSSSSFFDF
jgi:hypothetical protein